METNKSLVQLEKIEKLILMIRGQRVILDSVLAKLYGVETRVLNQAVKRNIKRFPDDFMFQIKNSEAEILVSQNVTPHKKYFGGHLPYAFTEQGVAMLSSALNSERAILVNIEIMRAFVRLRHILMSNSELAYKLEKMEKKYDKQFQVVFKVIKQLMASPKKKRNPIGFI